MSLKCDITFAKIPKSQMVQLLQAVSVFPMSHLSDMRIPRLKLKKQTYSNPA